MDLMRVWPRRHCPSCGGIARRTHGPVNPTGAVLAVSSELAGWAGLLVGAIVASALGTATGVAVGIGVGTALDAGWFAVIIRFERKHVICECMDCKRQLPLGQFLRRSNAKRTTS